MKSLWVALVACAVLFFALHAGAAVKREGAWPEAEKRVTLDLDGVPRGQALRKLADAAGWSLVVQASLAGAGDLIDVHVKDQPAAKVLDLVIAEEGWVAARDGSLVSLRRDASTAAVAAAPPSPPAPSAPPAPPPPPLPTTPEVRSNPDPSAAIPSPVHGRHGKKGDDRVVTGSNLVIQKHETVNDVSLFGGNLDVYGEVLGDVSVTGGNTVIHHGAHVRGDVAGVGGNVTIEDGAAIDGDVSVVGGNLTRGDHAKIGGDIEHTGGDDGHDSAKKDDPHEGKVHHALREVGDAITRSAFLFIFGAMVLALGTKRMEMLRAEAAARPMRSFALGVVGLLGGLLLLGLVSITIIGIPIAAVGLLVAIFAGYSGVIAVLTTCGEALFRHKTQNTYVHLALGCAMFLVASSLPVVGPFVTVGVALTGIGVVVATRGAGFIVEKTSIPGAGPYRTTA